MTIKIGTHLPQFGRAAVAGAVQRVAKQAEDLGFDGVWVSDHLVIPKDQAYPAAFLCDPLQTLAFAAAATERIGLGTSVLVGPQYTSPLALANTLATLDFLSGGRLTVGIGIGWSEKEYEALHAPFADRGARLDEIIDLFHTAWTDDPATHTGKYYGFTDIRILPKPAHPIPIWVGGGSDAALHRAITKGDGYHAMDKSPEEVRELVKRLRDQNPDPNWTMAMRMTWDFTKGEEAELAKKVDALAEAGVQSLLIAAVKGDLDAWLHGQEAVAKALHLS
ncbi:MAG: TIGR03619 family F420-dependent LLM class oxidoreductase [Acidobacteria bacterium]|nr:TIGR03619 family F420-dependent LLM class oxidoreductase [Acidobacteriota bacterium]